MLLSIYYEPPNQLTKWEKQIYVSMDEFTSIVY